MDKHSLSDKLLRIYAERGSADSAWMAREIFRLRAALAVACEKNGGVCAMGTHEAESDPCTHENCSTMRDVEESSHSASENSKSTGE